MDLKQKALDLVTKDLIARIKKDDKEALELLKRLVKEDLDPTPQYGYPIYIDRPVPWKPWQPTWYWQTYCSSAGIDNTKTSSITGSTASSCWGPMQTGSIDLGS